MVGEKPIKQSTKPAQPSSSSLWLLFGSISMLRKGIVELELCLSFHRSREADSNLAGLSVTGDHGEEIGGTGAIQTRSGSLGYIVSFEVQKKERSLGSN